MINMELVEKTGYTIKQLYDLALMYASLEMKKKRDRAEQENCRHSQLHYEELRQAFIELLFPIKALLRRAPGK